MKTDNIDNLHMTSKEIEKTNLRIAYFLKHVDRCKKDNDKAKLIIKISLLAIYQIEVVNALNQILSK